MFKNVVGSRDITFRWQQKIHDIGIYAAIPSLKPTVHGKQAETQKEDSLPTIHFQCMVALGSVVCTLLWEWNMLSFAIREMLTLRSRNEFSSSRIWDHPRKTEIVGVSPLRVCLHPPKNEHSSALSCANITSHHMCQNYIQQLSV